jgi:hypothetical protein
MSKHKHKDYLDDYILPPGCPERTWSPSFFKKILRMRNKLRKELNSDYGRTSERNS